MMALRRRLKSLVPAKIVEQLRKIKANILFRGSEPMALLSLKMKCLRRPDTLESKILYKMLKEKNAKLTNFADKFLVREIVAKEIGSEYLSDLILCTERISEIDPIALPKNYVVKVNHGSGGLLICWEGFPVAEQSKLSLPKYKWEKVTGNPESINWDFVVEYLGGLINENYYWSKGRHPEWCYKNIKPRILIEEVMIYKKQIPSDFKFFVFNGQCEMIQVDMDRFNEHKRNLYDRDWNKLGGTIIYPNFKTEIEKPVELREMLDIAERLGSLTDFARVDLYLTDKGVKFGEITNYPEGGLFKLRPRDLSKKIGKTWLPSYGD